MLVYFRVRVALCVSLSLLLSLPPLSPTLVPLSSGLVDAHRYAQVVTELGVVLSFSPPEGFQNLVVALGEFLSVTDMLTSAKWCVSVTPWLPCCLCAGYVEPIALSRCFDSRLRSLGIDSFYYKWRLQVLLIPAAMMVMPLAMYCRHYRKDRDRALARLTGHSFAVVFFCCMCTTQSCI